MYHVVCATKYRKSVISKEVEETIKETCKEIITRIKSIIGKEVLRKHPIIRREMWGSKFWGSGYFVNSVSRSGNENVISKYVKEQGIEEEYRNIQSYQLSLI